MITRTTIKRALGLHIYGGTAAYVRHLSASARLRAGLFRDLERVDWNTVQRLVYVCKGNICRSPYAEARSRSAGIDATSFGVDAKAGSNADGSAIRNASQRGLDLSRHSSKRLDADCLRSGDLVLGFEPWHVASSMERIEASHSQTTLAGLWADPIRPDLCDPYGRDDEYFQICFSIIDSAVESIRRALNRPR